MRLPLVLLTVALLAGACVQTGGTQRKTDSDAGTATDPTDVEKRAAVRLELAGGYFSRGQFATALDEIKLALAAKPDMGAAYNMRGLVYAAMGEDRQAEDSFERAMTLNPRDADAMHNRAWFKCQRGQYDDADRLFEQAIATPQYRDAARSLMAQGICNARAGRMVPGRAETAARLRDRSDQPDHGLQPGRRALPPQRAGARALLRAPHQRPR